MKILDAQQIAKLFLAGAARLQSKKEWINELNVFPVPDGDTGTNMTMTIMSAAAEVQKLTNPDMKALAKALSSGSLKGARGNSGVILSQLLRGFSKVIQDYEVIDLPALTSAMAKATETAYKAVMKPKEGTILTVARGMSEAAAELMKSEVEMEDFVEKVLARGQEVLDSTPEMLPVLKEAGVVDSGGQGLMQILYGALDCLQGKEVELLSAPGTEEKPAEEVHRTKRGEVSTADIKFGYCTEFIILLKDPVSEEEQWKLRDYLLSLGDSLVFVADDEIIKVHVHTNHPGLAFEKALEFGELSRMKIDNMREEHREIIEAEGYSVAEHAVSKEEEPVENKPYGIVTVAVGSGIGTIFRDLGADYVVEGGQTMNPSTQDILDAIDQVHADTVFVLPNNKNIILAAEQAARACEDKHVLLIPTVTIPQGIAACINFDPEADAQENREAMTQAKNMVKSAEVTYSIRDTKVDGFEISKGDIMGIGDMGIQAVDKDLNQATLKLLRTMVDDESGIISVYYGEETQEKDIEALRGLLEEEFEDLDIEILEGAQPVYYYIISVE